ncbi:ACT domain-containing protein [Roseobacter litoralis]|uniref:ACT domain-containing protein n=1 Tax=Roseobacter litoralis TaxID=42443 RepID=UPI00249351B5|nr:ACT domain-containing protein [Roseobacter litoralis]
MSGETDLKTLMQTMTARLDASVYVFATLVSDTIPADITPRMMFEENEGTTYILKQSDAKRHNLPHEFPCKMITLDVHSSLEAVGFIAQISAALAEEGMGVNPVSGFYHDHLFVPLGKEADAMRILAQLSEPQI